MLQSLCPISLEPQLLKPVQSSLCSATEEATTRRRSITRKSSPCWLATTEKTPAQNRKSSATKELMNYKEKTVGFHTVSLKGRIHLTLHILYETPVHYSLQRTTPGTSSCRKDRNGSFLLTWKRPVPN